MLQFKNGTPFEGAILPLPDAEGIDSVFTVLKGTFSLADGLNLTEEQVPVRLAQEHYAEADRSSIRQASDFSLMKPGTDILLVGHAYGQEGRPVSYVDVSLRVATIEKNVRVFGDRQWQGGAAAATISRPEPFESIPLVWERAYGGVDSVGEELHAEKRNPVGCGFRVNGGSTPLDGLPLPNLEDPSDLISSWQQRPMPTCLAPVAAHWEPRQSYAGTYDDVWAKDRAPYLPDDFDPRFFQLAPEDLIVGDYLQGGELVEIRGASASGWLQFRVPSLDVEVTYVVDGGSHICPAVLDTLIIEPDLNRVQVVWRTVFPCDKKVLRVSEVRSSVYGLPRS